MEKQIKQRFKNVEGRLDKLETTIGKSSLQRKGKLIRCDGKTCKHLWRTQSKMKTVSCPSCGKKVDVKKNQVDNQKTVDETMKKMKF